LSVVGGGTGYMSHVIFYVGVPDVEAALQEAERLDGKRQIGPERARRAWWRGTSLTPGAYLTGVAGPA
jgi:uncharacterized protein